MILQAPNPYLTQKCDKCDYGQGIKIGQNLKTAWEEYQKDNPDTFVVGMAAPQIGVLKRVFIAFDEVFINPQIVSKSKHVIQSIEGCCSLDNHTYQIERPSRLMLQWVDKQRFYRRYTFTGNQACIIQHELDHLDGKLISDKGVVQKSVV